MGATTFVHYQVFVVLSMKLLVSTFKQTFIFAYFGVSSSSAHVASDKNTFGDRTVSLVCILIFFHVSACSYLPTYN